MSEPVGKAAQQQIRVTRRKTKAGQRLWFSCSTCEAYGDASGDEDATEYALGWFADRHDPCSRASADQGPS